MAHLSPCRTSRQGYFFAAFHRKPHRSPSPSRGRRKSKHQHPRRKIRQGETREGAGGKLTGPSSKLLLGGPKGLPRSDVLTTGRARLTARLIFASPPHRAVCDIVANGGRVRFPPRHWLPGASAMDLYRVRDAARMSRPRPFPAASHNPAALLPSGSLHRPARGITPHRPNVQTAAARLSHPDEVRPLWGRWPGWG